MQNVFMIVCAVIASLAVLQDRDSAEKLWNLFRRGTYLLLGFCIPLFFYWIWYSAGNFWADRFLGLALSYAITAFIILRVLPWLGERALLALQKAKW